MNEENIDDIKGVDVSNFNDKYDLEEDERIEKDSLEEILEFHRDFVENEFGGDDIRPTLILNKGDKILHIVLQPSRKTLVWRDILHTLINSIDKEAINWAVLITCGYMKRQDLDEKDNYQYGELQENHDEEVYTINTTKKGRTLAGIYRQEDMEEIAKTEESKGYFSF